MIPDDLRVRELTALLTPHMHKAAWPGLTSPAVKRRAVRWARKLGVWQRITARLDPARPIPSLKRSIYRCFVRTGARAPSQRARGERMHEMTLAAMALWLEHPAGNVDYLQDLLWAWCETSTWVMAAHEASCHVDLGSSELAMLLAEIVHMLGDKLEDEVKARVGAEIDRRVLDPVHDWRTPDWWYTAPMNWNAVCNANLITIALYRIDDPKRLASCIHPCCQRIGYSLAGFADDGGCLEGPGYWNYGFGHFVDAAIVLHHRTGGRLNLMRGERIRRICRYPLAARLTGPHRTTFADSHEGYFPAGTLLGINRFFRMPALYEVAARRPDGLLQVRDWRGLTLYRGEKATGKEDTADYHLPELGQVKLRVGRKADPTILAAIAGRNDVPHNHNDIGSFILYRKGRCALTDPGSPTYTAKTFSSRRYEILFCRSRGHSVPLINGKEQQAGPAYYGTLAVRGLNAGPEKAARIDMTHAYDEPTLKSLVRECRLSGQGLLTITDTYAFSRKPRALEEAFITFEPARVSPDRRTVTIGKGRQAIRLRNRANPGRFEAERLVEESKEGPRDEVVTRIRFVPARLAAKMTLVFEAG
ncbi:MAG: heparinase II/III family protein [Kiritimatiellae bacterium]|nr:heparinase II/III family protein [Kiritimatiellia bacterium]